MTQTSEFPTMIHYSPISRDAAYIIVWENGHGEITQTKRHGKGAAEFIASLFVTVGCRLVGVVLA